MEGYWAWPSGVGHVPCTLGVEWLVRHAMWSSLALCSALLAICLLAAGRKRSWELLGGRMRHQVYVVQASRTRAVKCAWTQSAVVGGISGHG